MKAKTLVVLLVAIVVLFVVILAAGADRPPADEDGGGLSGLKGLRGSTFITLGDDADADGCTIQSQGTLSFSGSSCRVRVSTSGFFSRPRRSAIVPLAGTFGVTIDPGRGPALTKKGIDKCVELTIDRDGGRIEFRCTFGTCSARLLRGSCPL